MVARIESITFGDFSRKVTLNENVLKEFENTANILTKSFLFGLCKQYQLLYKI